MSEESISKEESIITEEIREMASTWRIAPQTFPVERGHILNYANAIGDPNPLWRDPEYARKNGYRDVVAPPAFIHAFVPHHHGFRSPIFDLFKPGFSASDDIEIIRPIEAGDVLTVTGEVSGLREKKGRPGVGRILFVDHSYIYTNQLGEIVGRIFWVYMVYEG